jgi:hypothetical protein
VHILSPQFSRIGSVGHEAAWASLVGQAIFLVSISIHSINEPVKFVLKSESKIDCTFQHDAGQGPGDAVFDRATGEGRKPPKLNKSPS